MLTSDLAQTTLDELADSAVKVSKSILKKLQDIANGNMSLAACDQAAEKIAFIEAGDADRKYFSVYKNKSQGLLEVPDLLDGEPSSYFATNLVILRADNATLGYLITSKINNGNCQVISAQLLDSK